MQTKCLELRDVMTFIPILCVDLNPYNAAQRSLMRRVGMPCSGTPNILVTRLSADSAATNDPHQWGGRTFPVAHNWIIENWRDLKDGDVIDVEYILGETKEKKVSEMVEDGGDPMKGFQEQDVSVTMTGYEWTAIIGRITSPDDLTLFGTIMYASAAAKLQQQLIAASKRYPSADEVVR